MYIAIPGFAAEESELVVEADEPRPRPVFSRRRGCSSGAALAPARAVSGVVASFETVSSWHGRMSAIFSLKA
jgi:hypothetical protein